MQRNTVIKPLERLPYQETVTGFSFDWYKFLDNEFGYDQEELSEAVDRAENWITCACGNQCAIIPRSGDGAPEDRRLVHLGIRFYNMIEAMHESCMDDDQEATNRYRLDAIEILDRIEVRSSQLIKEEIRKRIFNL